MNRIHSTLRMSLAPLVAALVLAGCATSASIDASSLPKAPQAFKENASQVASATTTSAQVQSQGTWWKVFADPVLDQLVEQEMRDAAALQQEINPQPQDGPPGDNKSNNKGRPNESGGTEAK